ncbi:hypothetical protein Tco_0673168 [Tanacetum coccineum]
MASGSSDRNAKDALSKLFQRGTVAEYQNEFEMIINRVTGISESLLNMIYISGLKPTLQCALLRSNPKTLNEAFSLARETEARFTDLQLLKLLSSNNSGLQNQNLTFTMLRQEPIDEAVFVKVNDETKRFGIAKSIEENNAFDVTSSGLSKKFVIMVLEGRDVSGKKSRKCLVLRPWQRKAEEGCCVMSKAAEGRRGKRVLAAAAKEETALFLEPQ